MTLLKKLSVFMCILMCFIFTSCEKAEIKATDTESSSIQSANQSSGSDTVDLTVLSSTMVYSEVYNMLNSPQNYFGKTVRMRGQFSYMKDEKTGNEYFAVLISDATACCSKGLEFVLKGEHKYPDDYPAVGSDVEVSGIFESYMEGANTYYRLKDAEMKTVA